MGGKSTVDGLAGKPGSKRIFEQIADTMYVEFIWC